MHSQVYHDNSTLPYPHCLTAFPSHFLSQIYFHASCFNGIRLRYAVNNTLPAEIRDCFFRDIRQPFDGYQPAGGNWAAAISLEKVSDGASAHNVSIHNNVGLRIDTFFDAYVTLDGLDLSANTVGEVGLVLR